MKVNGTYSFDEDILVKLKKEKNASELINFILRKHYNTKGSMTRDEIERELDETSLKISEFTAKNLKLLDMLAEAKIKEESQQNICNLCKKPILEGDITDTVCNTKGETISKSHLNCRE